MLKVDGYALITDGAQESAETVGQVHEQILWFGAWTEHKMTGIEGTVVEQLLEKTRIKIHVKYCRSLIPARSLFCSSAGSHTRPPSASI